MGSVSLTMAHLFINCFGVPDIFISPGMIKNPSWERFCFVSPRLGGSLKFLKDGKIGIILGNLDF